MKKRLLTLGMITVIASGMAITAYAGWEQNGTQWKYKNDSGAYCADGWQWIDGNNDGVAECYYFDSNGNMMADAITPDGYQVNGDGAWVEKGIVQNKSIGKDMGMDDTENRETDSRAILETASIEGEYWQKQVTIDGTVYQLPFDEDRIYIERDNDSYLVTHKHKIEYIDGTSEWDSTTATYKAEDGNTFTSFDYGWKSTIKIIDGMTLRFWQWENPNIYHDLYKLK